MIAQAATLKSIQYIAATLGIGTEDLIPFGHDKAKIRLSRVAQLQQSPREFAPLVMERTLQVRSDIQLMQIDLFPESFPAYPQNFRGFRTIAFGNLQNAPDVLSLCLCRDFLEGGKYGFFMA